MFLALLLVAITLKSSTTRFLLVEVEKEVNKATVFELRDLPGHFIDDYVQKASWMIMGYTNFNPREKLKPYEHEECFETLSKLFMDTCRVQLCSCDLNCMVKRATLSFMSLTIDFIREMKWEFGFILPLSHFFDKESVKMYMSYATPIPDQAGFYQLDRQLPTSYVLNNNITITFLRDRVINSKLVYGQQK